MRTAFTMQSLGLQLLRSIVPFWMASVLALTAAVTEEVQPLFVKHADTANIDHKTFRVYQAVKGRTTCARLCWENRACTHFIRSRLRREGQNQDERFMCSLRGYTDPSQGSPLVEEESRDLWVVASDWPRSCRDILIKARLKKTSPADREYNVYVHGKSLPVQCDVRSGGWTVMLFNDVEGVRDENGKKYNHWSRGWEDYKRGFVIERHTFWAGLETLHELTKGEPHALRVYATPVDPNKPFGKPVSDNGTGYEEFSIFTVGDEEKKYMAHLSGWIEEGKVSVFDCQDRRINAKRFSTIDQDNDYTKANVALLRDAGWWYREEEVSMLPHTQAPYYHPCCGCSPQGQPPWGNKIYLRMTKILLMLVR